MTEAMTETAVRRTRPITRADDLERFIAEREKAIVELWLDARDELKALRAAAAELIAENRMLQEQVTKQAEIIEAQRGHAEVLRGLMTDAAEVTGTRLRVEGETLVSLSDDRLAFYRARPALEDLYGSPDPAAGGSSPPPAPAPEEGGSGPSPDAGAPDADVEAPASPHVPGTDDAAGLAFLQGARPVMPGPARPIEDELTRHLAEALAGEERDAAPAARSPSMLRGLMHQVVPPVAIALAAGWLLS